jgi:queuosine precursor transporter
MNKSIFQQEERNPLSQRLLILYIFLGAFFLGNAVIAEFIGVKIFSVGHVLGYLKDPLAEGKVNMSIGVLIWPFVFLTSDLLNEYFGREGVRRISFITAGFIVYASLVVYLGTKLPPARFWLEANSTDGAGHVFNINLAYSKIFRQGIGIIIGSVTAFLISQMVDVYVFHYLRHLTSHRYLWLRATGSTIVSQLIDSFVILFIAFDLLGNWTLSQVLAVGVVQYLYKISLAILLTPLIYLAHYGIDRYLGREASVKTIEEADINW